MSRGPAIVVVEAVQDGKRGNLAAPSSGRRRTRGDELIDPLMRACLIEVAAVLDEHREQVAFAENEDVVEALPSHAPEKAFADRVRARSPNGRPDRDLLPWRSDFLRHGQHAAN